MDSEETKAPDPQAADFDFGAYADGRGAGELVKEIAADVSSLLRKEVELARLEISEILKDAFRAIGLSGLAIALVVLLLPLVVLSIIEVLAIWLPRWSATLIVSGSVGALAGVAFLQARRMFRKRAGKFVPEATVRSIKEDVEWAKTLKKP